MIDPVSEELEHRRDEAWPWRRAVAAALLLHISVAAVALLAPASRRRPLTLPSVQVRMASLPAPAAAPPPATTTRSSAPVTRPATEQKPPAARPKAAPKPKPAGSATTASGRQQESGSAPAGHKQVTGSDGTLRSGSLAVGSAEGDPSNAFPYAYYLNRILNLVEGNWFRPAAPAGTSCRVRFRVERSGRLAEVGIEQPSSNPAFDRAALRAVYACAPLPPLPEGYDGSNLTIHLEFGP